MNAHLEGDVIFEDRFDGGAEELWRIPPISLVDDPEHGKALRLRAGDPNAGLWLGWAGDDSWRSYRVEVEVLPVDGQGFVGLDFHVRDDESGCCNVHFEAFPAGGGRRFEGCGRYDDVNTSWKLWPLSQRTASVPPDGWVRLRLDPGRSEADGWGRLVPDQFAARCELAPGANEILVRLEVNEPLFGSGFWVRAA